MTIRLACSQCGGGWPCAKHPPGKEAHRGRNIDGWLPASLWSGLAFRQLMRAYWTDGETFTPTRAHSRMSGLFKNRSEDALASDTVRTNVPTSPEDRLAEAVGEAESQSACALHEDHTGAVPRLTSRTQGGWGGSRSGLGARGGARDLFRSRPGQDDSRGLSPMREDRRGDRVGSRGAASSRWSRLAQEHQTRTLGVQSSKGSAVDERDEVMQPWQQPAQAEVSFPSVPVHSSGEDPLLDRRSGVREVGRGGAQVDDTAPSADRGRCACAHGRRPDDQHHSGDDAGVSQNQSQALDDIGALLLTKIFVALDAVTVDHMARRRNDGHWRRGGSESGGNAR